MIWSRPRTFAAIRIRIGNGSTPQEAAAHQAQGAASPPVPLGCLLPHGRRGRPVLRRRRSLPARRSVRSEALGATARYPRQILHTRPRCWFRCGRAGTARKLRQRISAIMKWAVAQGYRNDNPTGDAISAALPKRANHVRHMPALPHREVAGAVAAVRASSAWAGTKLCFEFMVLTAVTPGEARGRGGRRSTSARRRGRSRRLG